MAKKREMWELQQMQALPLNIKIKLTQSRIRQWVNEFGEDGVFISFSGGKDSTVLLDIARKMYPEIKAVYVDTGLEYPEIREFVKRYEDVDWIRPKMNFREVITKHGYPFISKEVSDCVQGARKYLTSILEEKHLQPIIDGKCHYYNYECDRIFETANNDIKEAIKNGNIKANARLKILTGTYPHREKGVETTECSNMFSQERYIFFLNAPFEISNKCCNIMKKNPSHTYMRETGRKPITAQMASESRLRTQKWLQNGCNAFESKNPISNPMSFWTEQDVLLYIKQNNLHIASVYGDIVTDYDKQGQIENQMNLSDFGIYCQEPVLKTTGCNRTGCMFCGYGCHLEKSPNRFKRMAITHPKQLDYVMRGGAFDKEDGLWKPNNRGLGFWFVLKWINVHGNFNIAIPNYEQYEQEYGTELTREYLIKKERDT